MSSSSLVEAIIRQPKKAPCKVYHFEPFHQLYSCNGRYRIELFLMQSPTKRRVYLAIRDFEAHGRVGAVISEEGLLKLVSKVFSVFLGGMSMPLNKKVRDRFLEFYFKPRRRESTSERYIYRAIIHDCLREVETYASQVSLRYAVNPMWAAAMLRDMEKSGILKQSRKIGRTIMFSLAIDRKEVESLVSVYSGIEHLRV